MFCSIQHYMTWFSQITKTDLPYLNIITIIKTSQNLKIPITVWLIQTEFKALTFLFFLFSFAFQYDNMFLYPLKAAMFVVMFDFECKLKVDMDLAVVYCKLTRFKVHKHFKGQI